MDDERWPSLPQDPAWVLEQIEMGARQAGVSSEIPPPIPPKLNRDEIESAVTRLLQEELDRLEQEKPPKQ
jgi:hypothetical protein